MLKFFRNIRKKILLEGKTSKYFKYAIGEIVLVVIGILIALQINNWNENRKERIIEIGYLKNLKLDLQNDSLKLVEIKETRVKTIKAAKELLNIATSKTIDNVFKVDSLYWEVGIWWEFIPNDNTFQELISSGNLNIIKNGSIKNHLLKLSNNYEEIVVMRNHMRRDFDNYLYDQAFKEISFLDTKNLNSIKNEWDWFYSNKNTVNKNRELLISQYDNLLNNTSFINGLSLAAGNSEFLIITYHQMLKDIYILNELIDQEIKIHD